METKKTKAIFIIEDEHPQRLGMKIKLEDRGFVVKAAGTVDQAREILSNNNDIDVFLIDMRLDHDPKSKNLTGADLAIEFFQNNISRTGFQKPEFIILSAFRDPEFYEKALKLGVAAYLEKSQNPDERVIRHLRVLAIKRALANNITLADKIENVVKRSFTEMELYENFCGGILGEEFKACLGAPFLLLLTKVNSFLESLPTQNCDGGTANLPIGEDPVYEKILSFMYANADTSQPFVLDKKLLELLKTDKSMLSENEIEGLCDSAFVSLPLAGNFRLAIGILKSKESYAEPPLELARLLNSYVNPTAIAFLSEIIVRWHRSDSERKTTIKKLSTFCQKVGQEQLFILEDAALEGEDLQGSTSSAIRALAEDLYQTGRLLEPISNKDYSFKNMEIIPMRNVVDEAWEELGLGHNLDKTKLTIEGNCSVRGEKEELLLIVLRLLDWFARRRFDVSEDSTHSIFATCWEKEDESIITFEDNSFRIPRELREDFFKPFGQSVPIVNEKRKPGLHLALYLSQILVEEKYRGELNECSDDLPDETGHKIEIRIPQSRKYPLTP